MTDTDYDDDIAPQANTPAQAETLLHSLELAAACTGLHVNAEKTEYMCFNQRGDISSLNSTSLKIVDNYIYLGSSISSTEIDINRLVAKPWTVIDSLSVVWKLDLTHKIKRSFFQAAVVSILLYRCTTWAQTKRMEKKAWLQLRKNAANNIEEVQEAALLKEAAVWPPSTYHKTIPVRRTRHAEHCWRSRDEVISDILRYTPSNWRANVGLWTVGRPARTYIVPIRDIALKTYWEQWTIE